MCPCDFAHLQLRMHICLLASKAVETARVVHVSRRDWPSPLAREMGIEDPKICDNELYTWKDITYISCVVRITEVASRIPITNLRRDPLFFWNTPLATCSLNKE